jgi:hypothetical protein
MDKCVTFYIEENWAVLLNFAKGKCRGDWATAEDSVSHVYIKSNEPNIFCKLYDDFWAYNKIREYLKSYWRKIQNPNRHKEQLVNNGISYNLEKEFADKEYLNYILKEIYSFIRKKYPRAQTKYSYYFRIWLSQKYLGESAEETQKRFPDINIQEVQSRCSSFLSEFNKYITKKKAK